MGAQIGFDHGRVEFYVTWSGTECGEPAVLTHVTRSCRLRWPESEDFEVA